MKHKLGQNHVPQKVWEGLFGQLNCLHPAFVLALNIY